jgi:hypothetical protein
MMRRLQDEKQRFVPALAPYGVIDYPNRMMEERALLILGQQEHEQLLDDEIAQLKALLQAKENELQRLHLALKSAPHQQQSQSHRQSVDIVERLESLEHEIVQLKRRTPTLADVKCVSAARREQPCVSDTCAGTTVHLLNGRAVAVRGMRQRQQWHQQQRRQ